MNTQRILSLILLCGILAATGVAIVRATATRRSKAVELALSLQAVRESSASQAYSFEEMIQRYKEAGVTTLLISGTTLKGLLDYGATGYPSPALVSVQAGRIRVSGELGPWLAERLTARLGADRVSFDGTEITVRGLGDAELLSLDLGAHPADLELARRMGWQVAVQLAETSGDIGDKALLDGLPAGVPILWTGPDGPFMGAQEAMRAQGDLLLIDHSQPPFFAGMAPGVGTLFDRFGGRALKLFRATYSTSVTDILTAVKERNMQVVLVQPYHISGDLKQDLALQAETWRAVVRELEGAGFSMGRSGPLPAYSPPIWMLLLAGAAVGAATALLVGSPWWLAALGVVFGTAVAAAPYGLTRQAMALAAACVLPALGALRALEAQGLARRLGWLIGTAFGAGLLVTGLLANTEYIYEMALFRGIKVALVAPSVAFLAVTAWRERAALAQWWQGRSIRVWHLAVALAVVVAVPLMLIRSGQDSDVLLVTGLELKLRSALEYLMVVRPRFKEFLIGWPLLFLAHYALKRGYRLAGAALLAVGLVGPASLVNSFTHLHTPTWISAVRGIHGVWLGALLGGALLLALRRGERRA